MATIKRSFFFGLVVTSVAFASPVNHVQLETRTALDTGIANIHIEVLTPLKSSIDVSYGDCGSSSPTESHHIVARGVQASSSSRLVWRVPEDSPSNGCLTAWDTETHALVGGSALLDLKPKQKRSLKGIFNKRDGGGLASVKMNNDSGIDAHGPWFDGVAYLEGKNVSQVDVKKVKSKKIGIIGGGMSGLMSALILESHGFHNFEIIESSRRVGGRIRTVYLEGKPEDYQYQEMGPMRFPEKIQYPSTNETLEIKDHQIVFQLAEKLNQINGGNPDLSVDFIPWIQSSQNAPSYFGGIRNPDGTVPTVEEAASANVTRNLPPGVQEVDEAIAKIFQSPERLGAFANNMYRAHKKFIDEGWDNWSEFAFIRHFLGADLNTTDLAISGSGESIFWGYLFDGFYFSATTWKTIDKGLERLPLAFRPLLGDRVKFGRRIEKAEYLAEQKKVKFSWRKNLKEKTFREEIFDYALVTVPFTQVRRWRLPTFSSVLERAISKLHYETSCKVSLQFKTRFWEHLDKPIFGGCAYTDIPGIGSFCYPSYQLNRTGPGVLLASYNYNEPAVRFLSLSEEDHVQYVLNAMTEIHGSIAEEQYTGKHSRKCWIQDEDVGAGWADPSAGQHELYIPSYFETENNIIFIGEHTAYTHAWVSSALESAVRGTAQLMLELGLVDEAKNITSTWMGRWMTV